MRLHTTFAIGGPADLFVRISTRNELLSVLDAVERESIPFFILGGGANLLVGDRGIRGIVLDLGTCRRISFPGEKPHPADRDLRVRAEAGISVDELCLALLSRGISGLENFYGMPGSLGGSLFMNARCYEEDISAHLRSISCRKPGGDRIEVDYSAEDWAYKRSPFQPGGRLEGSIVLEAEFTLKDGMPTAIARRMRERRLDRIAKGHYRAPSAGSMFKNNRAFGAPTGVILERLGLKGCRIGDAAISPWHANIFINAGNASASDMRRLIDCARDRAEKAFGFELEPEVRYAGEF